MRRSKFITAVIVAGLFGSRAGAAPLAAPNLQPGEIYIEAFIDGTSELHITQQGIYWVQAGSPSKPGKWGSHNDPTYVNGKAWSPVWQKPQNKTGADTSRGYDLPIKSLGFDVKVIAISDERGVDEIQKRSTVTIADADKEQIVSIPDNQGGARWYTLKLFHPAAGEARAGVKPDPNAPPINRSPGEYVKGTLLAARWGTEKQSIDVSHIVAGMLSRGTIFSVNTRILGDPAPNAEKRLVTYLKMDGKITVQSFREGAACGGRSLLDPPREGTPAGNPPAFEPGSLPAGASIVSARWGTNETARDVTKAMSNKFERGDDFALNGTIFGEDPAPGQVKQFTVQYKLAGNTKSIAFNDGFLFRSGGHAEVPIELMKSGPPIASGTERFHFTPPKRINLIETVGAQLKALTGEWKVGANGLECTKPGRMVLPYNGTDNYNITVTFTRSGGNDGVVVFVPMANGTVGWAVGAKHGMYNLAADGTLHAIVEQPAKIDLVDNTPYSFTIYVRKNEVRVYFEGKLDSALVTDGTGFNTDALKLDGKRVVAFQAAQQGITLNKVSASELMPPTFTPAAGGAAGTATARHDPPGIPTGRPSQTATGQPVTNPPPASGETTATPHKTETIGPGGIFDFGDDPPAPRPAGK